MTISANDDSVSVPVTRSYKAEGRPKRDGEIPLACLKNLKSNFLFSRANGYNNANMERKSGLKFILLVCEKGGA